MFYVLMFLLFLWAYTGVNPYGFIVFVYSFC